MQSIPSCHWIFVALLALPACSLNMKDIFLPDSGATGKGGTTSRSTSEAGAQSDVSLFGAGGATAGSPGGEGGDPMGGNEAGGANGGGGVAATGGAMALGGAIQSGGVRGSGGAGGQGGTPQFDGGGPVDSGSEAQVTPTPEMKCAERGGKYSTGTCVFDCTAQDACPDKVTCPPDQNCRVTCGQGGCAKGVDCGTASECQITCGTNNFQTSCAGPIACSSEKCSLVCAGWNSCGGGVTGGGGTTDIKCSGINTCASAVSCGGRNCTVTCDGISSCAAGINLSAGISTGTCSGRDSCKGTVTCAADKCRVSCTGGGTNNCAGKVYCYTGDAVCPRN